VSDDQFEKRLPGRFVVVALGFLYLWGISALFGLAELAGFSFLAVLVLLVLAVLSSLSQTRERSLGETAVEKASEKDELASAEVSKSGERAREEQGG
jgi:choline-glycine betaine transporter